MNVTSSDISITVILPEASVAQLMQKLLSLAPGSCSGEENIPTPENTTMSKPACRDPMPSGAADPSAKYTCEVLGDNLSGSTLPEVFAAVVDLMDYLDPAALDKLSGMRPSNARNYISRDKEKVHIRSPRLKTQRTKSGWWISKNIGRSQLIGALQALCNAAGLEYAKDLTLL